MSLSRGLLSSLVIILVVICTLLLTISGVWAEEIDFESGGIKRNFILEYDKEKLKNPAPLVMIFHGGGGNSSWMKRHSKKLTKLLKKSGYMVAFMNGTGRFKLINSNVWNARYCCGVAAKNNVDDVAYIDKAIDIIASKYSIDTGSIFLIGHSNGGMLAYRAAATMRHRVKAVVVVSTAIFSDQPRPKRPFSLFMIHAKDDEILPYNGGMSTNKKARRTQTRPYMAFEDAVSLWSDYLCCGKENSLRLSGIGIAGNYDCSGGNRLQVLYLEKGGHKWNKEIDGFSISQVIASFIARK
ncbi:MAG: alpha/beta hydrolase [Rickettsiales bacterium]